MSKPSEQEKRLTKMFNQMVAIDDSRLPRYDDVARLTGARGLSSVSFVDPAYWSKVFEDTKTTVLRGLFLYKTEKALILFDIAHTKTGRVCPDERDIVVAITNEGRVIEGPYVDVEYDLAKAKDPRVRSK